VPTLATGEARPAGAHRTAGERLALDHHATLRAVSWRRIEGGPWPWGWGRPRSASRAEWLP